VIKIAYLLIIVLLKSKQPNYVCFQRAKLAHFLLKTNFSEKITA